MKNLIADINSRKYVAGVRQVNRHLLEGEIEKIYLASDCEEQFAKKVLAQAQKYNANVVVCGSRHEFAKLCGIEVQCAVIGVLKN